MTANYNEEDYTTLTEGSATILFPKGNEVFYNPVQQFNRDMSIAAIRAWDKIRLKEKKEKSGKHRAYKKAKTEDSAKKPQDGEPSETSATEEFTWPFTILEALAASGLRSVRYAKEIPNVKQITTNDLMAEAVESIERNVHYNKIREGLIKPNRGDACAVMYEHRTNDKRFDVVDLDPYGSAACFIDGAVQSVTNGGLLCVTCTDMGVLAGSNYTETCFAKYGGTTLRVDACHEVALRLLLNTLQTSAARYKRYIVPMASCSIDFYIRIFLRVYDSPAETKMSASKISLLYACHGCKSLTTSPMGKVTISEKNNKKWGAATGPPVGRECDHCGSGFHVGGPLWNGPIHDKTFVNGMLEIVKTDPEGTFGTAARMRGMLTLIHEELDTPLYYTLSGLSTVVRCVTPSMVEFFSAICNKGYKVCVSHAMPASIKTDAPNDVLWDIIRGWVRLHPVSQKNIESNKLARAILEKEPSFIADFKTHPDALPLSRTIKLVRYQENPEANWGPKSRAGSGKDSKRKRTD